METTSLARSTAADATASRGVEVSASAPLHVPRPRWLTVYTGVLVAVDALAMVAATLTSNVAWLGLSPGDLHVRSYAVPYDALALVTAPTWLAILALVGAYDLGPFGTSDRQARVRIVRAGAQLLAVVAVSYYVVRLAMLGRGVLVALIPLAVVFTLAGRAGAAAGLHLARRRGQARRTALVLGDEQAVATVVDGVAHSRAAAITVVGTSETDRNFSSDGLATTETYPNGNGSERATTETYPNGNGDDRTTTETYPNGNRGERATTETYGNRSPSVAGPPPASTNGNGSNGAGSRVAATPLGPRSVIDAVARTGAETVIIAGELPQERLREIAWALEGTGVDLLVTSAPGRTPGLLSDDPVADLPLLHVEQQ